MLVFFCFFFGIADEVPFGTVLGSNNNVEAYSNSNSDCITNFDNYLSDIYTGMKYQCVEYSRR